MWEELQDLEKKIDSLRDRVRRATSPIPATAREFTTLIAQEVTCREDDLTERTAVFYNGSPDSYVIHRLSVNVSITTPALGSNSRLPLERYAFGYMNPSATSASSPFVLFDFVWNYLVSSRQSNYSRQPVGSPIFNGLERSQAFDLYEPLILKPVDSVEFRLRPAMYALPGSEGKSTSVTYFVNFLAFGYRSPL